MRETFGEAWEKLFKPAVAHRGLWEPDGAPENSLAAFQHAAAADYSIELDVQLSADGEAMVFHDDTLERLTGVEGRLSDHTAADLGQMRLAGTEERIPTLLEALAVIGHRAMVFVELKTPYGHVGPLEQRAHEVIIDHAGPIAVIGFNPYAHQWFAQRFPGVLRGLNSYSYRDQPHMAREQRKSFAALEHVGIAKPHFLALGLDIMAGPEAAKLRKKGMPVVGWTVRDQAQWDAASEHCDNLIFEGLRPPARS